MWVYGLDWAGPGQRQVADACKCGNEPEHMSYGYKTLSVEMYLRNQDFFRSINNKGIQRHLFDLA